MLPRKPQTTTTHSLNSKLQTKKPYSLLSLGLQKLPGGLINYRAYEKNNANSIANHPQTHHKYKKQNNQNIFQIQINTNKIQNEEELNKKSLNQNLESKAIGLTELSQYSKNYEKIQVFNDQVIFAAPFLKLDNITNQMISQDEQIISKIDSKPHLIFRNDVYAQDQIFGDLKQDQNCKVFVDMKKKIKKLSKSKKFSAKYLQQNQKASSYELFSREQISRNQIVIKHLNFMKSPYLDSDVIVDASIYRNKLINQRIDNDVDTDDQQVAAGIRRLHKSLLEAAQQNQVWQRQKQRIVNYQQQMYGQMKRSFTHCEFKLNQNA